MEMYHVTIVKKPRKKYRCYLCGKVIEGEHTKIAGVQDGDFFCDRRHSSCHEFVQNLCNACPDGLRCTGNIVECFNEGGDR
jgi:hypothetical protein